MTVHPDVKVSLKAAELRSGIGFQACSTSWLIQGILFFVTDLHYILFLSQMSSRIA